MVPTSSVSPPQTPRRHTLLRYLAGFWALILASYALTWANVPLDRFPDTWYLGLREPIDAFQAWVIGHRATHPAFVYFFEPLSDAIDWALRGVEGQLLSLPWYVIVAFFFLVALHAGGLRTALVAGAMLLYMGLVGLWVESMQTLALMGVSVLLSLAVGMPLGIWAARNDRVDALLRPVLDTMQTMPAFVYLIPVLLFFGVARVPAAVATVIYALPPAIRLTNLGLRQVPRAALEAAESFGATSRQVLFKVQLPLAMPALMAGINQTIMMALGIVVIAALIGAGGLGREVLIALQRQQVGRGVEAGLAIVALAILLDRVGESLSRQVATLPGQRTRWRGFALLPQSWIRFAWARAMEEGLRRLGQGLLTGARILARLLGWPLGNQAQRYLVRHAYAVGSLALLLVLTGGGAVTGWRGFPPGWSLDLHTGVDAAVVWMRDNLYQLGDLPIGTGPLSDAITLYLIVPLRQALLRTPWPVLVALAGLLGYRLGSWHLALTGMGLLMGIGLLGMWDKGMDTLSQVLIAVLITVALGVPLGIWAGRSQWGHLILRPILDVLQTIPSFVFLVPVIMLFNVGRVPGIIASVLYALPPVVRLTDLGIRQVAHETLEAAVSFGSTSRQLLLKVQLPLAMPAILMGLNQTVMMVLAMVIIAGLVGGAGLGLEAVIGLAKNQTGRGMEAGLAIVFMAMWLDRLTQAWAERWKPPRGAA